MPSPPGPACRPVRWRWQRATKTGSSRLRMNSGRARPQGPRLHCWPNSPQLPAGERLIRWRRTAQPGARRNRGKSWCIHLGYVAGETHRIPGVPATSSTFVRLSCLRRQQCVGVQVRRQGRGVPGAGLRAWAARDHRCGPGEPSDSRRHVQGTGVTADDDLGRTRGTRVLQERGEASHCGCDPAAPHVDIQGVAGMAEPQDRQSNSCPSLGRP